MKLLLTSSGITNKSIESAFQKMVNKPFNETLVAFIPTAANCVEGDKWWVIKDLAKLTELGCKTDIVDISALTKERWLPRLKKADVIFVEGGDTFYLMDSIHRSGGYEDFKKLLDSKIYVGVSAGATICAKNLALSASQAMYDEGLDRKEDVQGLDIIPFYVFPHFNSKEWFPKVTKERLERFKSLYPGDMYLIDDKTAISVIDAQSKLITEGVWEKISS